ncbi:CDGSH iron-sulfur domain-containing protein 3, mitochondrial isoform X1 [Mustela nigripes]|uniref:CDGSH iron-sulfur domain-containing protein 3, mitochondrial isoform X1 n=1 Tax=Mustela nigripes TaxID=77151 RepID=UPI0003444D8C|nr:CDGSH iron-sulfur domain-containing protein 3, mitochondrial isoform X1 [Mustela nigripes]
MVPERTPDGPLRTHPPEGLRAGCSKLNQSRYISSWLTGWFPKTPAKSVVAQKTPIKVELVAGKTYRWCVCGRSKKQEAPEQEVPRQEASTPALPLTSKSRQASVSMIQSLLEQLPPFCDGSHFFQRTGLSPLKFKAQETRAVALCTCKATQKAPYCDGTHRSERVQKAEVGSPL